MPCRWRAGASGIQGEEGSPSEGLGFPAMPAFNAPSSPSSHTLPHLLLKDHTESYLSWMNLAMCCGLAVMEFQPLCSSGVRKMESTCTDSPSENLQGHQIERRQENTSSWFSTFMLWPQQKQKPSVPHCARMPCLTEQTVLWRHVGTAARRSHPGSHS